MKKVLCTVFITVIYICSSLGGLYVGYMLIEAIDTAQYTQPNIPEELQQLDKED